MSRACPKACPGTIPSGWRWSHTGLAATLAVGAVGSGACEGGEAWPSEAAVYPSVSSEEGGMVRFDLGSGSLETVNDDEWGGTSILLFPPALDSDAGPIEVEILGLDLSTIDYRGGLGWPSDPTDAGALVSVGLYGSTTISYRIFSMVNGLLQDRGYPQAASKGVRAYAFHGYDGIEGPYGMHNLGLEEWGPEGDREPYNTFDIRLRLKEDTVSAWVRLHSSLEWETGGSASGTRCPWNVAINNAAPGTTDSVWSGECRAAQPGRTGRSVGAWVPVQGGPWRAANQPHRVQFGISVSNWEHADGPYRITWKNVVLRGPHDTHARWSLGGGRALAFGTGQSELHPRGAPAEFRYVASAGSGEARDAAVLDYRSSGLELRGEATHWVRITDEETRIFGTARVNGVIGHRYELTGISGREGDSDRFLLQVWDSYPSGRPLYTAFGLLVEGAIAVWPGVDGPTR